MGQIYSLISAKSHTLLVPNTSEICEAAPIAHSIVQTLLRKLEAKGAIAHEIRDRIFVFRPLSQESEITATMSTVSSRLRLTIAATAGVIGVLLLVSSAPAQVTPPTAMAPKKLTLIGIGSGKIATNSKHDATAIFGPQGDLVVIQANDPSRQSFRYTSTS